MKVSDYIVRYLERIGVTDVFGYPGGMITHLMDSLSHSNIITSHLSYNEQGAAMAAVGYAQASHKPVMVFTSSGPGATNLLTGLCNAWFDSVPVLFITGNVNTYESRGTHNVRQKGFQEAEIVDMVAGVTKYVKKINNTEEVKESLETAIRMMSEGRPGPCLLDIAMDVTRGDIEPNFSIRSCDEEESDNLRSDNLNLDAVFAALRQAERPVLLLGNGIHICGCEKLIVQLVQKLKMPVLTSLPASDLLSYCVPYSQGFIGAYGKRSANIILEKSDLVIAMGSRLDNRQTGTDVSWFATKAQLIRFEIDKEELGLVVKEGEIQVNCNIRQVLSRLIEFPNNKEYSKWLAVCSQIQGKLRNYDKTPQLEFLHELIDAIPDDGLITTDVGQNQIWVPQAMGYEKHYRVLFSAGFGAMGYSLPAAIGASIACKKDVYCFNGDGGIQMNIQELQFIVRENLPVKIVVLNNSSLGMIRHFQELYFDNNSFMTNQGHGYSSPCFAKIANAYGIPSISVDMNSIEKSKKFLAENRACLLEVMVGNPTYLEPKSIYNKPLAYQLPEIPKELQNELMSL